MRKATFSATFWRFVGDAKSKSCENIWHLVSRAICMLVYIFDYFFEVHEKFQLELIFR